LKFLDCAAAEPLVTAFLDGELPMDEASSVESHVASCPRCGEVRDEVRALSGLLRLHFAARAETIVTLDVLDALEGEVTQPNIQTTPKPAVAPERAEADTLGGNTAIERALQSAPAKDPFDPRRLVGTVLGGYRIDKEIARGGMGTVYRATQLSMDRTVALKVLSRKFAVDETFKKRFVREARASATIEHPNVIKVYDAGEDRQETFFAMELIDGDDAETLVLRDGAFSPQRGAEIGLAVARALEAAHARGVVHRDVKPANVLLTLAGAVKLADLGLAKLDESAGTKDGQLTLRKVVMGSPNYMPPEQAMDARDTDQRSDVYSLGATLFHLVVGERPYGGGSAVDIIARVVDPAPLDVPERSRSGGALDPRIRAIIAHACSKDRARRYPTATALREDLETYLTGGAVAAPAQARVTSGRNRSQRQKQGSGQGKARTRPSSNEPAIAGRADPRASRRGQLLFLAAGTLLGIGASAVILRRQPSTDGTPAPVAAVDSATDSPGDPPPVPPAGPPGVSPVSSRLVVSPDAQAAKVAYQEAVTASDRLRGLDRPGAALEVLDAFTREHQGTAEAERTEREARDLRARIARRFQDDLDRAMILANRGEYEGAESALSEVESYGDVPARAKAKETIDSIHARAKKDEKPPEVAPPEKPPEVPPPPPVSPEKPPENPDSRPLIPPPLGPVDAAAIAKLLQGKVEGLPGGRVRLGYDFQATAQADDWVAAAREPGWLFDALDGLPVVPPPAPFDKSQKPWTVARGTLLGQGFERRRTKPVFAVEGLRIEVTARLLYSRNLIVTLGAADHPFVIALGAGFPEGGLATKQPRSKEQLDVLAKLQKKWHAFSRSTLVVAREAGAFDWEPTAPSDAFQALSKGTHLVIEARRGADGDALIVSFDKERVHVALGHGDLAPGPVGIEVLGRPVAFESIVIEGAIDPEWARQALAPPKK
jgi:serine/threonine-protein kinase